MQSFIDFLQGKKSYLLTLCLAIFNMSCVLNWLVLTAEEIIAVNGVIFALFGASMKAGVTRELKGKTRGIY